MNKRLVFPLIFPLIFLGFTHLSSQSLFKANANVFGLFGRGFTTGSTESKMGLEIGHQHDLSSGSTVRFIMSENLVYRRSGFEFRQDTVGGYLSTRGDINYLDVKVDFRVRFGIKYFIELGIFTSYAVVKNASNGYSYYDKDCPNFLNCDPSSPRPFVNYLGSFDAGWVIGASTYYKDILFNFHFYSGIPDMAESVRAKITSQQLSFGVAFPLRKKKKVEKVSF
jgi:Outer membrane protein beta-barrel domain